MGKVIGRHPSTFAQHRLAMSCSDDSVALIAVKPSVSCVDLLSQTRHTPDTAASTCARSRRSPTTVCTPLMPASRMSNTDTSYRPLSSSCWTRCLPRKPAVRETEVCAPFLRCH